MLWVLHSSRSRAVDESRIERSQGIGIELTTTCRARLISRYYSVKVGGVWRGPSMCIARLAGRLSTS